ncbi:asparagine synthase, glutamine-hydrolyzing [Thioploca ingrica]|uniref:asparagine synthase (glutamine-hydrolyzing) n=1 Tax=Thioploca ingrica TaxID=40754 RepID=A0A090AMR3_9GAMM|nr:asparagine synthase, glutamine-hydrolyzing [Thioploca ingrica]
MCGIAGFVGTGTIADLQHMTQQLIHRGPDAQGLWHDAKQGVYLGHRRLSIIDLVGGKQPMWTPDEQLGIIFNGEIYNHLELRQQLEKAGYHFSTHHSDTEVLLHGYRAWGKELPNKLNGMWAFVLYDRQQGILFGSRDRFGKKPFFYTHQLGNFIFASELKAVTVHTSLRPQLSKLALKKYFAYGYIPAPHSLYENIYKLPAGHSLWYRINTKTLTVQKYWDFELEPFDYLPKNPEAEWGEQLRELLDQAVQRRLMSDVPLGVFLSGGIDSSAIAALASKHIPATDLNTFSIGFTEPDFDEAVYAKQVAQLIGSQHHSAILSLETSKELLPEIMSKLDEPLGDSSLLPTYLLCHHARQKVTVALGGDGGDELFAGYDPFQALRYAQFYHRFIPKPIHRAIEMLFARLPVSYRNMSLDFRIKRTLRGLSYPPRLWCPTWMASLAADELADLFQEKINLEEIYSEAIEQWEACHQTNLIDKILQFFTKLYLQDDILVKIDRASMLVSLEARSPFLDIELVNFVRQLPSDYKFRHGQTKYILKKALEPLLPKEIIYRRKKGFGVPIGKWFHQQQLAFTNGHFSPLNPEFINRKLAEHTQQRVDQRAFLWNLWVYQAMS